MNKPLHDPGLQGDLIVNIRDVEACELGKGTSIKLLRYDQVTGDWVLWVTMQPGATFAPHWHLGHGQYFIVKGELIYDVGSADAGTYGYEPIGSVHAEARCEVETEYLFMGHGAVAFTDENKNILFVLNHEYLRDVWQGKISSDISNHNP